MVITIPSQIYHNTEVNTMMKVALVLFTAMLVAAALGYTYHVVYAQSFSKKSSTNCEGDVCRTLVCINNNCHTSISNPAELLNSMPQIKSHGLLSNSIQQLLNSTNP
ncbi:MAG TPA: hypothetical protein VEL11_02360 [Candidatus Bathyarchaeia archaeon]|nr:hypothetical protein [Candidatus Bathyarchaeia archaeon]